MRVRQILLVVTVLFLALTALALPVTSPDAIATAVAAPLAKAKEVWTGAMASGSWSPIFANLAVGKFGVDGVTQNVTIESSINNADRTCLLVVAIPVPVVAATDTCAEVCTAGGVGHTCSEGSGDGEWLDPGETYQSRDSGAFCYCGRSAANSPVVQGRRIAR